MQLCHHHLHPEIKKKIVNVGSVKLSNFFSIFSFYFFFFNWKSEFNVGCVWKQSCVIVVLCFLLLCGVGDVCLCCFSDHFS